MTDSTQDNQEEVFTNNSTTPENVSLRDSEKNYLSGNCWHIDPQSTTETLNWP